MGPCSLFTFVTWVASPTPGQSYDGSNASKATSTKIVRCETTHNLIMKTNNFIQCICFSLWHLSTYVIYYHGILNTRRTAIKWPSFCTWHFEIHCLECIRRIIYLRHHRMLWQQLVHDGIWGSRQVIYIYLKVSHLLSVEVMAFSHVRVLFP